jgi:hypothetical protein
VVIGYSQFRRAFRFFKQLFNSDFFLDHGYFTLLLRNSVSHLKKFKHFG